MMHLLPSDPSIVAEVITVGTSFALLLNHLSSLPSIHRSLADIIIVIILCRILDDTLSESDVDPTVGFAPLGNRMLPIVLRPSSHNDHVSALKLKLLHWSATDLVLDVTHEEVTRCAEGDRGDTWIPTEEGLAVRVIRDGIVARGVVIDEGEVVCVSCDLLDCNKVSVEEEGVHKTDLSA